MTSKHFATLVVAVLLSACATRPVKAPAPSAEVLILAEQRQSARESALRMQGDWSMEGRIAISNGSKGGSGRIDWQQDRNRYVVSLSAPVTRQSWRLSGDLSGGAGRLEGLEGGPREGPDAEQLLLQATGWEIPLRSLQQWVRGMATTPAQGADIEYTAEGQLLGLREQGWRIDYLEWFESTGLQPAMPRRIEAVRGQAKVRLVIDRWSLATP